jgi:hypothetical protein
MDKTIRPKRFTGSPLALAAPPALRVVLRNSQYAREPSINSLRFSTSLKAASTCEFKLRHGHVLMVDIQL